MDFGINFFSVKDFFCNDLWLTLCSFWLVGSLVQTNQPVLLNESCQGGEHNTKKTASSLSVFYCTSVHTSFDFLPLHLCHINTWKLYFYIWLSISVLFNVFLFLFVFYMVLFSVLCCGVIFSGYGMLWCFSVLKTECLSQESSAWQPVSYTTWLTNDVVVLMRKWINWLTLNIVLSLLFWLFPQF